MFTIQITDGWVDKNFGSFETVELAEEILKIAGYTKIKRVWWKGPLSKPHHEVNFIPKGSFQAQVLEIIIKPINEILGINEEEKEALGRSCSPRSA